jgi:hypothetical protein
LPPQAEAAYAQGKDKAAGAADYAKETAQQAADATYDAAGQAKEQVPARLIAFVSPDLFHMMLAFGSVGWLPCTGGYQGQSSNGRPSAPCHSLAAVA